MHFRLCGSHGLGHNYSTLSLQWESSCRYISRAWLHSVHLCLHKQNKPGLRVKNCQPCCRVFFLISCGFFLPSLFVLLLILFPIPVITNNPKCSFPPIQRNPVLSEFWHQMVPKSLDSQLLLQIPRNIFYQIETVFLLKGIPVLTV